MVEISDVIDVPAGKININVEKIKRKVKEEISFEKEFKKAINDGKK